MSQKLTEHFGAVGSSGLGFGAGLSGLGFLGLVFLGGSVYKAAASNAGGLPP
jgi:hypothetical protein